MILHHHPVPQFEFHNFVPTQSTNASANATLNWLMEVMPADATVGASLCKIGSKFLCKVDVISSLGTFRGEAAIGTWLYRITFNRAMDLMRRRGREPRPRRR